MQDNEMIDKLRLDYMSTLAEIASMAVDRHENLPSTMGMNCMRSPQDAAESERIVAQASIRITERCNKLRAIEQRSKGAIGIPSVLGKDVPNAIRVAVAILAGKATSGSWPHETHSVGSLLQPAGGADPKDLLAVREAFRQCGILRPHIHCEQARTIDELSNLAITETSYRLLLALEPDSECDELIKARKLVR